LCDTVWGTSCPTSSLPLWVLIGQVRFQFLPFYSDSLGQPSHLTQAVLMRLKHASPNAGPDGPLHNEYWKQRMRGGEWILRNALLDGDMDKVFELLQVQNPDTPENPGALPPPNAFGDVNTLGSSAYSCLVYLDKVSKELWAAASDCTSCCIDVCAVCCCSDTSSMERLLNRNEVVRHPADQAEGGARTRSTSPSGATTNTRPNDDDIALKKLPADFSLAKQYTDGEHRSLGHGVKLAHDFLLDLAATFCNILHLSLDSLSDACLSTSTRWWLHSAALPVPRENRGGWGLHGSATACASRLQDRHGRSRRRRRKRAIWIEGEASDN